MEHHVLNDREVRFAKNDGNMCRVVCKDKKHCNYIVLCSRILRTTKYGRKILNKNASIYWVFRIIVDKLKNNTNMKLNEVVAYERLRFAT